MHIFKKPNSDSQSNFKKANPLLGFRFVYKDKKSDTSAVPSALLYGLESNIKAIEEQIKNETDESKKQILQVTRSACINSLEVRKKSIDNQDELKNALDQIGNDDRILESLKKETFDYIDIEYLLNSDLRSFFDENLKRQIEITEETMIQKDFINNTLRPDRETLVQNTKKEWEIHAEDISEEASKLSDEKENIENQLKEDVLDKNQKRQLAIRLEWINNFLPNLLKQKSKPESDWVHKQVIKKEQEEAEISLLEGISPEVLNKLKNLVLEARFISTEKIREYIETKFSKAKERFEKIKKAKIFGKSTIKGEVLEIDGKKIERRGLQKDFDEFNTALKQAGDDPELLKKISKNLYELDRRTSISIENIQRVNKNRPDIEKEIIEGFESMNALLVQMKPEELERLKEVVKKSEIARLEALRKGETRDAKTEYDESKEGSLIYKKKIKAIEELANPESDLHKKFQKYQGLLKNIENLEPEEIAAIQSDLETLRPKLELIRNLNENVEKALKPENDLTNKTNQAIIEIKNAVNAEEIKNILNTNLGSEHVELVSHSEFNSEWKESTSEEGFMVFQKKGNEVQKIIIDKSVFEGTRDLKKIKEQLTHELLHLQFENNEDIRNIFHKEMVEKNKEWPKIKRAFIDWMKSDGRKPPSKKGWTDKHILSELYAMQNEMGNSYKSGNSAKAELNNLLAGIGVKDIIKNIEGKTKHFIDNEKEEERYGYAGGDIDETSAALSEGGSESSSGSYDEYKIKIEFIDNRISDLQKSEFLGYISGGSKLLNILKKFNNYTKKLNQDFKIKPDSKLLGVVIGGRNKDVEDELTNIAKAIGNVSSSAPNMEINIFRRMWNSTSVLSIQDMIQTLVDAKEFIERRHNRRKADHAAQLGMSLFQGTDLGREAWARKQKAEMEEVQEWQSRYENLDAWQLQDEIKKMAQGISASPDRLKAILRLLAQKGRIDWKDENLWKVLNKLQSAEHMTPGDSILLHDPPLLRQKLHAALGEIWDYDEYLTLERQNESSYDSELRKYLPSYDRIQDVLNDRLDQLLSMYRQGEKVDPMEYESIIVYAIEKGKSFAEQVMFHLLVGMADGLLNPDRGMALDKYLNEWPATQWIYSKKPPLSQADYKRYCQQYFKKDYDAGKIRDGYGEQFMNFYWVHVQNDDMTIQRVRKSVSERKWDHDWTRSIACLGDSNTAKRFFSGRSGQQETKDTGVENAYAGAVQWIEENARMPEKIDFRKHFARHASWCAMAEGIMDRVAYYRGDTDITTRANENMERGIAREQSATNHANWTMRDNRNKVKTFLDYLDPDIFQILRSKKDLGEKEEKAEIGMQVKEILMSKYSSYAHEWENIKDVDGVYERMDLIIQVIFESISDAQLKSIIAQLRP